MDKYYVGLDITGFENNGKTRPISRITLKVDDDNALTAGDDTGLELAADCPHATQKMVDALLTSLKGKQYQMYRADAASLDPAAELGDGVTVNGVYSAISRIADDGSGYADISAPGEEELEDEYPAAGPMTQEFNRKIAETRSSITKTSEEITLKIESVEGEVSTISQKVDNITLSVSNGSTSSTINLMVNGVEVSSQSIGMNGLVTYTGLSSGTTTIDGGCIKTGTIAADRIDVDNLYVSAANITGRLTIGKLPTNVATDDDIPTDVSDLNNDAGYQTERGVVSIIDGTVTADYVEALGVTASTLTGDTINIRGSNKRTAGSITATGAASYSGQKIVISSGATEIDATYGSLYLEGGSGAYLDIDDIVSCGGDLIPSGGEKWAIGSNAYKWTDVYCKNLISSASDRGLKKEISYTLDQYEPLFDLLKPCTFQFINSESGRTHMGMIAQDIEQILQDCNIDTTNFAAFIKSPKVDESGQEIEGYDYALRYGEFIALLIWQVQKLKARVTALEAAA